MEGGGRPLSLRIETTLCVIPKTLFTCLLTLYIIVNESTVSRKNRHKSSRSPKAGSYERAVRSLAGRWQQHRSHPQIYDDSVNGVTDSAVFTTNAITLPRYVRRFYFYIQWNAIKETLCTHLLAYCHLQLSSF